MVRFLTAAQIQVLGVDPPRPLPSAAYDLQTALESVQHFATQTLAGVVQAEATRGSEVFEPSSGAWSPRKGGGGKAAKAAAKENWEAAAAAGLREGWEKAWPPRELTKELGLVTARQMAHVMRCDAEPLIQVYVLNSEQRGPHHKANFALHFWSVVCVHPSSGLGADVEPTPEAA